MLSRLLIILVEPSPSALPVKGLGCGLNNLLWCYHTYALCPIAGSIATMKVSQHSLVTKALSPFLQFLEFTLGMNFHRALAAPNRNKLVFIPDYLINCDTLLPDTTVPCTWVTHMSHTHSVCPYSTRFTLLHAYFNPPAIAFSHFWHMGV